MPNFIPEFIIVLYLMLNRDGHRTHLVLHYITHCLCPVCALQYLGHVEVEESRGMHICEDAVKRLKTVGLTRKPLCF